MFDVLSWSGTVDVSGWWYLLPGYLTVWSLVMGGWNFVDGEGMFARFGIDLSIATDADRFGLKSSAARYLGIGAALVVGVFLVDAVAAAATALLARLVMDVLDLVAGVQTRQFESLATGVAQSTVMFIGPGLASLVWLLA
ncbi:MAG: hypothetical protein AAGA93_18350 [Actinomycetota bacterium]